MPADSTVRPSRTDDVLVAPLAERDLPEAERIVRLAFGTFLGAPDPASFWSDRDYVYGRWRAPHVGALGASLGGRLVGSNFATRWGTVGFFGPLTVRPDLQASGVGKALLDATMAQFRAWDTRHLGLFTFPHSAKHVALYQKFGFHPRFLTAIMSAPAARRGAGGTLYSTLDPARRQEALRAARDVAETIHPGLDLSAEIEAVLDQGLGDTVLMEDGAGISAFAICHYGPRSEAGDGACFIKFGAVRSSASADRDYLRLLDACEALALEAGQKTLLAGANMARPESYYRLIERGFRTVIQGVAMHHGNDPGYARPGLYVIEDWR